MGFIGWISFDLLALLAFLGTRGFLPGAERPAGAVIEEAGAAAGAGVVAQVGAGFVGEPGEPGEA